jgi:hypothetical protein
MISPPYAAILGNACCFSCGRGGPGTSASTRQAQPMTSEPMPMPVSRAARLGGTGRSCTVRASPFSLWLSRTTPIVSRATCPALRSSEDSCARPGTSPPREPFKPRDRLSSSAAGLAHRDRVRHQAQTADRHNKSADRRNRVGCPGEGKSRPQSCRGRPCTAHT